MLRREGETLRLGTAMGRLLQNANSASRALCSKRPCPSSQALEPLRGYSGPGEVQKRPEEFLVHFDIVHERRPLAAPIAGNRRDELRVTVGEIALIFRIELHHEARRLVTQGGENLPPDTKRGESMV